MYGSKTEMGMTYSDEERGKFHRSHDQVELLISTSVSQLVDCIIVWSYKFVTFRVQRRTWNFNALCRKGREGILTDSSVRKLERPKIIGPGIFNVIVLPLLIQKPKPLRFLVSVS